LNWNLFNSFTQTLFYFDECRRKEMLRKAIWLVANLSVCLVVSQPTNAASPSADMSRTSSRHALKSKQGLKGLLGQGTTLLPDGNVLLTGGEDSEGPVSTIAVRNAQSGTIRVLDSKLLTPRAWHSATLLPDGTVFIFGGMATNGSFEGVGEIFNPLTQTSQSVSIPNLLPRAHHSATLLTEGRVLIAGGLSQNDEVTGLIQIWDPLTGAVQSAPRSMLAPREGHSATLNADGSVLFWGGRNRSGISIDFGEVFDPSTNTGRMVTNPASLQPNSPAPFVEVSIPADNSTDLSVNTRVDIRFSKPLAVQTVNANAFSLSSPAGIVDSKIVPAEGGMLGFVTPTAPLSGGTTYTLTVSGAKDSSGNEIQSTSIIFTTAGTPVPPVVAGNGGTSGEDGSGPLNDTFHRLPPLQAPRGVTALAGQVLKLNAMPLAHVLLQIDEQKAYTDTTGRFLLENITPGHHAMVIDGATANHDGMEYGIYDDGVDITAGQTNVLNYKIWMTRLDRQHEVTIPSPTTKELVITTPRLPGLELHLPPNTIIKDRDGNVVTHITITPIPVSQPPFPLPVGVEVPTYFTIQPGGAYLDQQPGSWGKGARLFYPNWSKAKPGTQFDFWNYDPLKKGWYVYGEGTVSKDGRSVVPNPGVEIYQFTGAMFGSISVAPSTWPWCHHVPFIHCSGDPVDLSTGLFQYQKTDLFLPDVMPLTLERSYRQNDNQSRPFGIGASDSYEIFLVGDTSAYSYVELVLSDGFRVHFYRTTSGTSFTGAAFAHTSTPTSWYGATVTYNTSAYPGAAWVLTTKDGTNYYFPDGFGQTASGKMSLLAIRDRNGNTVSVARDSNGNITQVTSPNGRYIKFQNDSNNRITLATDNVGRTVQYQYDSVGRLGQVTDVAGGVWEYTYDTYNNMLTIQDARGITYLTNQYDLQNRVYQQTQADGGTFQYSWTASGHTVQTPFVESGGTPPGGSASAVEAFRACSTCSEAYPSLITNVNVTDPRGYIERVSMGVYGLIGSDVYAMGQPEEQTISYVYYPDNLLKSVTDGLGRVTAYNYDANANITSVTALSGTSNAVATSFTFDPTFSQVTSVTDPLSHTTSFGYDTNGNLTSIVDPLSHHTTLTHDTEGKVSSIADALGNTINFSYFLGDLTSITDPLSRTTTRFMDGAGRLSSVTNPLGQTTTIAYNGLNLVTSVTDPLNGQTSFGYDANGNILTVTDANSHTTTYTYNNMDRVATRKDALLNQESYQYDLNGNLSQFTDRRGKVSVFSYDGINRKTFAGYGMTTGPTYESTVTSTYDAGNRLTQAVDSISGTITRAYDGLDRLSSETTPGSNTVSYTYDAAGRRASLAVPGQSTANYTFDNANRLTQITQGSATVSLAYDIANRRTTLTLPNGTSTTYSYDSASQLTGLTYANGSTSLGNLTYTYDMNGRRINLGGSLVSTGLPGQVSASSYNANNQLTTWGTANLYYDANGNMSSDGTHSYTWDARNRLIQIDSGSTASFIYDAFGRRTSKTVLTTQTGFLYDAVNPIQELSGSTVTANSLMGGVDEVFQRTDSAGARSFLSDGLGSIFALADSSGTIQTGYTFDPFGNTTLSGSSTTNSFAYTGRELDASGLYYYRARYYSPQLQKFISEDPFGFGAGDTNLYTYTRNSPTNFTDAYGKCPVCIGAGVGALAGIAGQAISDALSGQLSSGSTYLGAAAGGAVAGVVLTSTGNLYLAGAAGGAAGNLVKQGINNLTGEQDGFNVGDFAGDTGLGFATGLVPDGNSALKGLAGDLEKKLPGAFGAGLGDAAKRIAFPETGENEMHGRKSKPVVPPGDCPPENSLGCVVPLPF
jgi:RHS repeat-associated protein